MVVLVAWLVAVGGLGLLLPVTTSTGWLTMVGFGLVPCVLMLRAWRRPTPTMSERIHTATRQ